MVLIDIVNFKSDALFKLFISEVGWNASPDEELVFFREYCGESAIKSDVCVYGEFELSDEDALLFHLKWT